MIIDAKFLFEMLFLPAVLGIGILSSLSDIRSGKVKNSLIKKGFLYGLVVYFLLIIWTLLRNYAFYNSQFFYLKLGYFPELLINVVAAFAVGIIFWKYDIWAAADAKLFALYSFLLPLTVYSYERMPYFPSFALLVNIFFVSLLYLLFIYSLKIKIKRGDVKRFFSEKIPNIIREIRVSKIFDFLLVCLFTFGISFFIFSWEMNKIRASASLLILFYVGNFFILMLLGKFLNKYKKAKIYLLAPAIIGLIVWSVFSFAPFFVLKQLLQFVFYMIIINLVFRLLSSLGTSDLRIINVEELGQNMILTGNALKLLGMDEGFYKNLGDIYPDGLSSEQTEKIKEFLKNKNLRTVEVYRTFPFAPLVFIGAIITLVFRGSLIGWLIMIL
jgi:hypothetical protein